MSSGRTLAPRKLLKVLVVAAFSTALALPAFAGHDHDRYADHEAERAGARYFEKAYDQHRREDYASAAEAWQRAYEAGYNEATSAYNTACALSRLGETERAIDWLETAIDEGFKADRYLETDDDLINLRAEPRFRDLRDEHRTQLERRGKRGAYAVARDALEDLEDSGSDKGGRWYDVGLKLHRLGEYDDAIRAWQRAVELDHNPGASTYNIACAQARKGATDLALTSLALAVERGYGDPDYFDEDDDLDSIRDTARFDQIRATAELLELPSNGWQRGKSWFFGPGWQAARERYESHVASNPASGRGFFNIGYASLELDDAQGAVEAFEKAHALGFRASVSAYNVACSYARLDDRDAAFDWLDRAVDSGFSSYGHLADDDDLDNLRDDSRFDTYRELAEEHRAHYGHGDWREQLKQGLRRAFGHGHDDDD